MDNPLAFPSGDFAGYEPGFGMTLRDWFAGQALVILPQPPVDLLGSEHSDRIIKALAACSYALADAMLAERAKGTPSHG